MFTVYVCAMCALNALKDELRINDLFSLQFSVID